MQGVDDADVGPTAGQSAAERKADARTGHGEPEDKGRDLPEPYCR
jgi:hypothetical protein